MTGANTSDKVLVVAIRGISAKTAASCTMAQTNLSPVFLYVTSGDGFYTDGSFVFHSTSPTRAITAWFCSGTFPNW